MFYYEGQSCPVCGQAFTESDDIVSCPECGAPHHRACWMTEGHCHYADAHGTDRQWKRPEETASDERPSDEEVAQRCWHCGRDNPTYAEFCARCGKPLDPQKWAPPPPHTSPNGTSYTPFHAPTVDPTGSVSPEAMLDEDVTAADAALAVGTNQPYYLPRFERMQGGDRPVSWNWVAFLFPAPWFFYRKQYAVGGMLLAAQIVLTVLTTLLMAPTMEAMIALQQTFMNSAMSAEQYAAHYMAIVEATPWTAVLLSLFSTVLSVLSGMFGNYLYRQSVVRRCRKLKTVHPTDYKARLPIEGGVTAALFALALLAGNFLPEMICQFL